MDRVDAASIHRELVALLPRLRRFACGLSGSLDRADDLVQAACERALSNLDKFAPGSRLDSWMFRIVQNLWVDRMRSDRRWQEAGDDALERLPANDMEREIAARMELVAVRRAIAALPPEQRIVLMLVTVEGKSYREASEILAIPIGTIMSRLARARLALTKLCAEPSAMAKNGTEGS